MTSITIGKDKTKITTTEAITMRSNEEILLSGRRSGRTSRMLMQALIHQKEGRAVYVLCAHKQSLDHTANLLVTVCNKIRRAVPSNIKFETWETLGRNQVDLENTRLRNAHPNCLLLIDHHFFEYHFSFALCGYHQWDKTESSEHWAEKDWELK